MSGSFWKILVVDDELVNIKLLQKILEQAGYQVTTATDGPGAREKALTEAPDLILLDIMMPEESGFDTCAHLKADSRTADIPVIFLSALEDIQSKVQGFEVGGVDYVTKPFQNREILVRVKTQLKLRHTYKLIIEEQTARLKQIQKAQQNLLVDPSELPEAGFGVSFYPIHEAGGDVYDVFKLNENNFGYFLGDVSGHDLQASFTTSALKALVRQNFDFLYSPEESMRMINQVLISLFSEDQHMTAAYVHLDKGRNKLSFVSAAHPPLIYMPAGDSPCRVETEGDPMGIFRSAYFESCNGCAGAWYPTGSKRQKWATR